jgi:hypothetical protein
LWLEHWLFTDPSIGGLTEEEAKRATQHGAFDADIDGDSGTDTANAKRAQEEERKRKEAADPDNMTPEQKMERLGALHNASKIITFPVGQGISGLVFSSHKLFRCNDAEKESNFSTDIDN